MKPICVGNHKKFTQDDGFRGENPFHGVRVAIRLKATPSISMRWLYKAAVLRVAREIFRQEFNFSTWQTS